MKAQNISIDDAIKLVSNAFDTCQVKAKYYTKMKADEKETWITENRKTAWFGSSYKRWEHKWTWKVVYYTEPHQQLNWYRTRMAKLETLLIKTAKLKEQGIVIVTLEDDEINLINLGGLA